MKNMDRTGRQITKIAREVGKFTVSTMKAEGIGTAEFDFIHLVRHHPGLTQAQVREELHLDKGASARRAASLEAKGYLTRLPNPGDGRSMLLYATAKADELKNSKATIEAAFYAWLLDEMTEDEKQTFCTMLDQLYCRCKQESRSGFLQVKECVGESKNEKA